MNTVPAQEIKRRGVAAIDDLIDKGAVHIIRNNRPQYVVLTQERYQDLLESEDEAWAVRVRESLEDYKAGRVRRFNSAEELLQALDEEDEL